MLRIGLTQRVEVLEDRGERRDALDQAWPKLLARIDAWAIPLANSMNDPERLIESLQLDGVILTGGNDLAHMPGATNVAGERDAFEARLLRYCEQHRLPVLGVCRGMQMLVDFNGGRPVPIEGHVARMHGLRLRERNGIALDDRDTVNSYHGFGIREGGLGPVFKVIAEAPDGTVEAIAHRELPQWGIMWHPERAPRDPRDEDLLRTLFNGRR